MADNDGIRACSYFLVRYVPCAEREEFLNIGVLLHSPEEQFLDCLFTGDFRRVKRFHPQADLKFLRDLQSHFEKEIQQHEDDLGGFIAEMERSLSSIIQLAPGRPILAAEPQVQLPRIFERLIGERQTIIPAAGTRMRIKKQLVDALRRAHIYDDQRLERGIPAAPLTHPGDPFHFDFGYRPLVASGKPNGHLKLIHALSLHRDHELASVLSTTMGYVRARQPAELTAVIDAHPQRGDKAATHCFQILKDAQIGTQAIEDLDSFARGIRNELSFQANA